jgi:hypothetical protein
VSQVENMGQFLTWSLRMKGWLYHLVEYDSVVRPDSRGMVFR